MSSDPTVLGMINDKLTGISTDVKEIKKDMRTGAVKMENHRVRLENIETDVTEIKEGQKKIKETFWKHTLDKKKHYNQGFEETFTQRAWRKKGEIGLITAVLSIISWVISNYFGKGGT